MSQRRLKARVPSASFVAVASLVKHDLRFHKKSRDGSAKCDAYETRDDDHVVIGVVFEIPESGKSALDKHEGLGSGYEVKVVEIKALSGEVIEAITYYATHIDPVLQPYHWYKEHVLKGAEEHGLPEEYLKRITNIESIPDPKSERHESEMAIYASLPLIAT